MIRVSDLILILFKENPKARFKGVFRERIVLLVPPIVDLGFFEPKAL